MLCASAVSGGGLDLSTAALGPDESTAALGPDECTAALGPDECTKSLLYTHNTQTSAQV